MIRIITDSAADLTAQDLAQPGVAVVPMCVTFADDTTVEDDGRMTRDEFFTHLANDPKLPRTSQPSPAAFMEAYADAELAGEEAVVITVAAKLSGTYQSAKLAAEDVDTKVYVIDSETATQGEALIVREALRLREEGLTAGEIAEALERFKKRIRIVAVVDSLKHLHKGGRIPAAVAIVAARWASSRSSPCMTVRSSWRARGAAVRARWWQCSNNSMNWAALTPITPASCFTVMKSSWRGRCIIIWPRT